MESESAIVLVPETDNDHIKLIELNELKLKSPDDYFPGSPKVSREQKMITKSPHSILYGNRQKELYKSRTTVPLPRYDDLMSLVDFKCLVCNENGNTASDGCLNIFKGSSNARFPETCLKIILSDILQREISKENIHSEYICSPCYELLSEWNHISTRLKTIERILITMFQETCDNLKAVEEMKSSRNDEEEESGKNQNEPPHTNGEESSFKIRTKRRKVRLKMEPKKLRVRSETNLSRQKPPHQEHLIDALRSKEESRPEDCSAKNGEVVLLEAEKLTRASQAFNSERNDLFFDVRTQSCDSCNFKASSATALTRHRQSHFCHICGLFVTFPEQMKIHLIKVHNFSKKSVNWLQSFCCNICSKKYSSKGSLHNHKKTVHSESKAVCQECGRTFRHSRLLAVHAVRHQEKKIKCTECDAAFFLTSDFNKHTNQVHRKVRPYECPKCGHYFCQRSTLTHHLSQHTSHEGQIDTDTREQLPDEGATLGTPNDGANKKLVGLKKTLPGEELHPQENDAPYVSLEFDLAHHNPVSEDERDEIEINLNFESPAIAASNVASSMSPSNQCLDAGSFPFPPEPDSSTLLHNPTSNTLNQAVLRLDAGNRDHRVKYPNNSVLLTPQDVLFHEF